MIRFRIPSKQRRIAFKSDAALFVHLSRQAAVAQVAIAGAAFLVATTCLSGCTFGNASVSPQERTSSTRLPGKTVSAQSGAVLQSDAKNGSGAKKPATQTSPLQSWANALFGGSKNQSQSTSADKQLATAKPVSSSQQPLAYIDVKSLAQRHPAWQLAEQLAASKSETVDVAFPKTMPRANISDLQAPSRSPFVGNRVLDTAANGLGAASPNVVLELKTIGAARRSIKAAALQNGARRQSAVGLNRFLQAARADQQSARRAQKDEASAALEDDLASREIDLPTLEPVGLPPAVQLEITNLRLKLLPNSNTSAPERLKAQARLATLQETWKDKLRAQETQLLGEGARQRDEEPLRLRREGEAQIAAQMQRARNADEARLARLRNEQQRFLAGDFSSRQDLTVTLPPFSVYRVRGALMPPAVSAAAQPTRRFQLPEMAPIAQRVVSPSLKSGSASVSLSANAARANALRTQALQDARGWAQTIARSRGWRLTERAPGVPDQTRFALQKLDLP